MRSVSGAVLYSASDLVNYLGCHHLTQQDLKVLNGKLSKPEWNQPALVLLQQLGIEHEAAYFDFLERSGFSVKILPEYASSNDSIEAMKEGYDIIAQARLELGNWMGYADILRKVSGESKFGNYYYQVEDTKLAQVTKAGTLLQLCLYTEILNQIQGADATTMKVVKPGNPFEIEEFNYWEFDAYFRLIKNQFENTLKLGMQDSYPEPVAKCNTCAWWKTCNDQWHLDDHLSLVAGLQTTHRKELESQEINTLEQYAHEPTSFRKKPKQGSIQTFEKLHGQAKVQLEGRLKNKPIHHLLPIEPERGFNRLPEPNAGDIYFDFEGEHFYEDGGLEYLFGFVFKDSKSNKLQYEGYWALNRVEEKKAFMRFIEFLVARWNQYPDFYIYHYAPYEPAAIKRLAQRHAVYENEVDNILRSQRFIDLYRVIKEGLQASVEQYSLKDLEKFAGYIREMDLQKASEARRRLGAALNLKSPTRITEEDRKNIEKYNEDDCIATAKLHDWLESIFQDLKKEGKGVSRPELKPQPEDESITRAQELYEALVKDLPEDPEQFSETDQAKWLLANMVDYFWRELKTKYWEKFRMHEMTDEELLDERNAIAYLTYQSSYRQTERSRVSVDRYTFIEQEVSLDVGSKVEEPEGDEIGTIVAISREERWVEIKKTQASESIRPTSVHSSDIIRNKVLSDSLHHYVEHILENGFDQSGKFDCITDLVLDKHPNIKGVSGNLLKEGELLKDAAVRLVNDLDHSILPIQGPPGTGKTYVGGLMILDLLLKGKRVGVTAVSHKVIQNLINKTLEHAKDQDQKIGVVHKTDSLENLVDGYELIGDNSQALSKLEEGKLVGGTAYFWARAEAEEKLDYLFVDEAGQMSLSQVIAASRAAKNIVMLGDPQQLEQPQKGSHPEHSDVSGLNHILGDKPTMPLHKGLFLDTSYRLPASICQFNSQVYYESKLGSLKGLEQQRLEGSRFNGNGLFYIPVEHEGNQNKSTEEIEAVASVVDEILSECKTWVDLKGKTHPITKDSFRIVAPYNVQVSSLKDRLPDVMIGTVDKFQGQEAPILIYSMTSSSPEDAPRGMSFLYNPNRFNVAISRAQCVSILICSPKLMEPECHSVDQMKWANGLCKYMEMAKRITL